MRSIATTLTLVLVSCSLSMTACGVLKSKTVSVLHDSNVPVAEVYNKDGQLLEGVEGYAKGYVANMVKRCEAILDERDRTRK